MSASLLVLTIALVWLMGPAATGDASATVRPMLEAINSTQETLLSVTEVATAVSQAVTSTPGASSPMSFISVIAVTIFVLA